MQLSNLLSVLVALGFVTKTHALRSSNEQLALAQLYDSASGTYSDYYVKDDGSYTSYITANVDWSYYEGSMEYFGLDDDCGYNLYYYTSDGVSQSSYVSADGEYLSYYDFITGEFYDFSYNYYFEDVSADGSVGSQYYLDSDGVYFTYINWDMTNGYYLEYIDLDTDIQYYADDMWYYTVYYNALTGDSDTYYADYFNEYTDDDTYYSVVYASPDWSEYHGSSYYTTDVMDVTYEFNSNGIDSTYVAYADGLYTSYYDGIADLFYETVYEAPVDVYYSNVSEDGTTYTYSFVDGDGCYSYSGIIENYDYDGTVYIDENGHATTYYAVNSGCLNQYYDHLYEEYSEYHDFVDEQYTSLDGNYYSDFLYDGCTGEYNLYTLNHVVVEGVEVVLSGTSVIEEVRVVVSVKGGVLLVNEVVVFGVLLVQVVVVLVQTSAVNRVVGGGMTVLVNVDGSVVVVVLDDSGVRVASVSVNEGVGVGGSVLRNIGVVDIDWGLVDGFVEQVSDSIIVRGVESIGVSDVGGVDSVRIELVGHVHNVGGVVRGSVVLAPVWGGVHNRVVSIIVGVLVEVVGVVSVRVTGEGIVVHSVVPHVVGVVLNVSVQVNVLKIVSVSHVPVNVGEVNTVAIQIVL